MQINAMEINMAIPNRLDCNRKVLGSNLGYHEAVRAFPQFLQATARIFGRDRFLPNPFQLTIRRYSTDTESVVR
jgi:hypothetical protein